MVRRFAVGDEVKLKATGVFGRVVDDNGHAYKISIPLDANRETWFYQDEVTLVLKVLNDSFRIGSYNGGMEREGYGIEHILKPSLHPFHCSGPGVGHTVDICVEEGAAPVLLTHIALHGAPGCGEPVKRGRIWASESMDELDKASLMMNFETDKLKTEWSAALPAPMLVRAIRVTFDESHGKGENVDVGMLALIGVLADEAPPSGTSGKEIPGALEVTDLKKIKKRKNWLPLESNPNVVSKYLQKLGVSPDVTVHELLSMEDWALEMIPRPARAILLCFPISRETEESRKAGLAAEVSKELPEDVVHMRQMIGNACGTIAIIHVMANLCRHGDEEALSGSWLEKFLATYQHGMTSDDVGKMLEEDAAIEAAHAAAERESEARNDRTANKNLHFIAFVDICGLVVELDGRNDRCIVRGKIAELGSDFLSAAVMVIRVNYVDVSKDALRFNMMAVCGAQKGKDTSGSTHEAAVEQLMAFGFDAETARNALLASGGNVELAANMLFG